ncbi:hypothetical protein AJ79_08492 [Helicocarpus griseus UAMH5409]|uniref:Uncharacterized protein n=1 Tax=Helicocarpus griseus UAMH5409 TaxID=1447875 RepID=A0A2B7WS04_9EURO|nr:hypothetical protein AJ79_08492 [Helicocarpus griseus UAMH5409]
MANEHLSAEGRSQNKNIYMQSKHLKEGRWATSAVFYVTIHYRDEFSLGAHRQLFGHAAYHWGLLFSPKKAKGRTSYTYDVSDAADPHPVTRVDRNPERNWVYRPRDKVDPALSTRLLGRVMIGKIPNNVSYSRIQAILNTVPLLRNGFQTENCVSWTRDAIGKLQKEGLAERFNIDNFMDDSLQWADERLNNHRGTSNVKNYTSCPM